MANESKHSVLERAARAKAERDRWSGTLADAYRYCLPGSALFTGQNAKAPPVDPHVYDGTAPAAINNWSSRMAYAIGLGFQELVTLEPGRRLKEMIGDNQEAMQQAARQLEMARDTIDGYIQASNFIPEALTALRSVAVSTGVLLVHEGTDAEPLRFEAVPLDQVTVGEGPRGTIENVYREQRVRPEHVERLWPGATLSEVARKAMEDAKGEARTIQMTEATEWDADDGIYRLVVVENETGHECVKREMKETRWIVFRRDRDAGQVYGSGQALRQLPDIKTANKTVELVLKNASIAVAGMWQADDDGVINPANIRLVPGAIIPKAVGSQGLQPLETSARFDVAQIVLKDLRQAITLAVEGPPLPGVEHGVRSATEWAIREQQHVVLMAPEYARLYREMVVPLYRIAASILERQGLLGELDLVGGTVRVVPKSPYQDMANRTSMASEMQGVQAAAAIDPQTVGVVLNTEKQIERILGIYGIPKEVLRTPTERQQVREQIQQAAALEAQRQMGGNANGGGAQ